METCKTCKSDLAFPNYQHLEVAGPGAAAHMSLHLNHNVKERKIPTPKLPFLSEGDHGACFLVTSVEDRVAVRCGEWLLGAPFDSVNALFPTFVILLSYGVKTIA